MVLTVIVPLLLALCSFDNVGAWRQWPSDGRGSKKWVRLWGKSTTHLSGPGERYGHSMVLHGTRIILFGGRANDVEKEHIPRSHTVADHNGTIEFASFWDRVYDCKYLLRKRQFFDPNATLENENCTEQLEDRSIIPASYIWNDVWLYELNCTREWQMGCSGNIDSQWQVSHCCGWHFLYWPSDCQAIIAYFFLFRQVVHEGAIDGGCKNHIEGGGTRVICTVPSERYFHGAAHFDDSTMLVYGGFSNLCVDYCDDLWSLDLRSVASRNFSKMWTEVCGAVRRVPKSLVYLYVVLLSKPAFGIFRS